MTLNWLLPSLLLTALCTGLALPRGRGRLAAAGLFTALLCAAFALYLTVRSPYPFTALREADSALHHTRHRLETLAKATSTQPDDAQGWVSLGDFLLGQGAFAQSAESFRRATLLTQGEPRILIRYLRAQILAADGEVRDDVKRGLDTLALLVKDVPLARYEVRAYLALHTLQQSPSAEHLATLRRLMEEAPAPLPLHPLLEQQIEKFAAAKLLR